MGAGARPERPAEALVGHDPKRFDEFARRYREELGEHREALAALRRRARDGTVTIVFAARDEAHSNAAVLAQVLARAALRAPPGARVSASPG